MPRVAVTKMHGTLNDFVVLDQRTPTIGDTAAFARSACDRRAGVGADGLIVVLPSERAYARMQILNPDGKEAEMCGNGMRCMVRYLCEGGEGERFRIETAAGIITADVLEKGAVYRVRVNMGVPQFDGRVPAMEGAVFVSVGNPHAVIFEESLDAVDLPALASGMGGMNVHLAVIVDRHCMAVNHYERGVGITPACGTGAVACAAAAIRGNMIESPVDVRVPGGTLRVQWDGVGEASLTGPAVRVFDAQF